MRWDVNRSNESIMLWGLPRAFDRLYYARNTMEKWTHKSTDIFLSLIAWVERYSILNDISIFGEFQFFLLLLKTWNITTYHQQIVVCLLLYKISNDHEKWTLEKIERWSHFSHLITNHFHCCYQHRRHLISFMSQKPKL